MYSLTIMLRWLQYPLNDRSWTFEAFICDVSMTTLVMFFRWLMKITRVVIEIKYAYYHENSRSSVWWILEGHFVSYSLCLEKKLSGNVMRLHIVVSMRQGEQKRPGGTLHGWPSSGSRGRRQQERRRLRKKVCWCPVMNLTIQWAILMKHERSFITAAQEAKEKKKK